MNFRKLCNIRTLRYSCYPLLLLSALASLPSHAEMVYDSQLRKIQTTIARWDSHGVPIPPDIVDQVSAIDFAPSDDSISTLVGGTSATTSQQSTLDTLAITATSAVRVMAESGNQGGTATSDFDVTFTIDQDHTFDLLGSLAGVNQRAQNNNLNGTGDAGLKFTKLAGGSVFSLNLPVPFVGFPLPPDGSGCLQIFTGCYESDFASSGLLTAGTYRLELFAIARAAYVSIGLPSGPIAGTGHAGFDVMLQLTPVPVAVPTVSCDVAVDQASFAVGDIVILSTIEVAASGAAYIPAEIKVWMEMADGVEVPIVQSGGDGSVVLFGGVTENWGPQPLLGIDAATPKGEYIIGCRIANPTTLDLLSEDTATFTVD